MGAVVSVHEDARSVLASARRVFGFARQGQADFAELGQRRQLGFYTAVTQGRSVTFVLQNLKGKVDGFEEWYRPTLDATVGRHPDTAAWFVMVRNRIEKQGSAGAEGIEMFIESFRTDEAGPWPEGATSMFVGDQLGRSGWDVTLPDGTNTQVFFKIPNATVSMYIEDAPQGRSVEDLLDEYLDDLSDLVAAAEARFG